MITGKIFASTLAALALLSLSACSNADYSNADDTLPKVSDAKPKVVVLDGFKKENIAYLDRKSAKLPPDGKTLSIDTTQTGGKFFLNLLKFKTGMLKPNTAYVFNMTAKVEAGAADAYLHVLVRNTANFRDGTDALRFNVAANGRPEKFSAKFKTEENGGDYALVFTAFSKLAAVVESVSIVEDDSFRAIPIEGNKADYVLDRSALPTGAKEFDIDLPNNPNGAIVRAKDFGITPEKTVHPKDINKAVEHCKKIGAAKLLFEKDAVYNIVGDSSIWIAGTRDFTFDANGSTFVFLKKKASNFWIADNVRIKICNLKIDWDWNKDPLASLVKITEVNDAEGYVEFKFVHYDDFPYAPDYVRCATLSAWDEAEKSVGVEGVMPFNYDMFSGKKPRPKFKWSTPNTIRFYGKTDHASAKVGRMFRMQHYYYDMNNFVMTANTHITLSDITVYSNPGHAFVQHGRQKFTHFERVKIVPKRGDEKRVITCTADHYHIASSLGYIKLDGCEFSFGADDCINMHDNSSYGTKCGERSMHSRHNYGKVGDPVEFRNTDYSPLGFTAKIVSKRRLENGYEISFDKPLPKTADNNYIIFNRAFDTRNVIVRNSYFHHNRARGILVLARDVLIENCKFKRNEMGAIKIETGYTQNTWCEGFGVNNIVVRGNSFDSCNQLGMRNWNFERDIFIGTYLKGDPSTEQTRYPIIRDILFEKNTFKDTFGMVATIGSAQNVVFSENVFTNETKRETPRDYRNSFFVMSSSDVKIVGNKFEKSNLAPNPRVVYDSSDTGKIVVRKNTVK